MSLPADTPTSLSALKTAQDSFRLAWGHRDDLLRLAIVPTLGSFALQFVDLGTGGAAGRPAQPLSPALLLQVLVIAGDLVLTTLFSVNWLRVLLLSQARGRPDLGLRWTRAHGVFLLRSLLLAFGLAGLTMLGASLASAGGSISGLASVSLPSAAALVVIGLAATYLFLRLSLTLPAAAVDHPYSFLISWRDTAPVAVPLLLATILVLLALSLAALLFGAIGGALYPRAPLSIVLLGCVLEFVFTAVVLGIIAIAFHRCTGWRDPGSAAGGAA